jgi:hypothetical protein
LNLPDWVTNPTAIAALAALATLLATKGRPFLAAAVRAAVEWLKSQSPPPASLEAAALTAAPSTRCEVLRGVRHQISEQDDPAQRADDLKLCDDFRTMLKRLDGKAVAS